jgi:ABC-type uncharacterized transport system ATPase subunit
VGIAAKNHSKAIELINKLNELSISLKNFKFLEPSLNEIFMERVQE